jgi:hypothetical protein
MVLVHDKLDRQHLAATQIEKPDAIASLGNHEAFAIGTNDQERYPVLFNVSNIAIFAHFAMGAMIMHA